MSPRRPDVQWIRFQPLQMQLQSLRNILTEAPNTIANQSSVRRLPPVEYERLMGFPDDYTRIPWRKKPAELCPDGLRHKACGNSQCVNVMRWISQRIDYIDK
jgi:cytosine-specific methyltransferase